MCRLRVILILLGVGCLAFSSGCVKPPPGYPTREAPPGPPPPPEGAEAVTDIEPEPAVPTEKPAAEDAEEGLPEDEITRAPVDEAAAPAGEPEAAPAVPPDRRAPAPAEEWEGVVGREAPPAETRAAAPRRRAAQPARPRPAAARPRPAAPKPAGPPPSDPVWDRIAAHEWGDEGRFPWASELDLTTGVLARFSNKDRSIMAMEILARRGKPFEETAWRRYFDKQPWYYPQGGYSEEWLGPIERGNYKLIRDYQKKRFGRPWEPPADWGR